jgi:hypothetical protein
MPTHRNGSIAITNKHGSIVHYQPAEGEAYTWDVVANTADGEVVVANCDNAADAVATFRLIVVDRDITDADLRALLTLHGATVRKRDGEYRVCLRGGTEDSAYYTGDRDDALETGVAMAAERAAKGGTP